MKGRMIRMHLAFEEIGELFSKVDVSFYIPIGFSAASPTFGRRSLFYYSQEIICWQQKMGPLVNLTFEDGMVLLAFLSYRIAPKIKRDEQFMCNCFLLQKRFW